MAPTAPAVAPACSSSADPESPRQRTKQHTFTLASACFTPETPSVSIVHERGRGIAWRIWPAAHVLTEWLQTQKTGLFGDGLGAGRIFIEVGAGVGLVGLVAAAMGGCTALTDLSECLEALDRSKAANSEVLQTRVHVLPLTFGNSSEIASVVQTLRSACGNAQAEVVVLGSDLVYFESLFVPLAQTFRDLCWNFGASVYLAYKKRIYKNEKRFFHKILAQHSLDLDVVLETTVHEVDGASQHADGQVRTDINPGDDADAAGADAADAWNTRIFRIKQAAVWREPATNRAPATATGAGTATATAPATAPATKEKKEKKGKVPCAKDKRGRVR